MSASRFLPVRRFARGAVGAGGRAFTLIELLVVIAIIAVLVAILLPALASSRAEGMKAKCLAHMRSLGQSMATYSIDDPRNYSTPIHPAAETRWHIEGEYEYGGLTGQDVYASQDFIAENRLLNRYVFGAAGAAINTEFRWYQCPGDTGIPRAPYDFDDAFFRPGLDKQPVYYGTGTSFRLNNHADFVHYPGGPFSRHFYGPYFRPVNRVPNAGETVLLEEAIIEVAKWNAVTYRTPGWHRKDNTFNVTFVDGHSDPIFLKGQTDLTAQYPTYWVLRGQNWRMDCHPDPPVFDLPP